MRALASATAAVALVPAPAARPPAAAAATVALSVAATNSIAPHDQYQHLVAARLAILCARWQAGGPAVRSPSANNRPLCSNALWLSCAFRTPLLLQ